MIVISDTSPIRALCHLQKMELLHKLFGEMLIPPAVEIELASSAARTPSVDVRQWDFIRVESPADVARVDEFAESLDPGESEALALAIERNADAVLIDERAGRDEARRVGLVVIGTLGILVRSKQQDFIEKVQPLLEQLMNDFGFFVSDQLFEQILRMAGEFPE